MREELRTVIPGASRVTVPPVRKFSPVRVRTTPVCSCFTTDGEIEVTTGSG